MELRGEEDLGVSVTRALTADVRRTAEPLVSVVAPAYNEQAGVSDFSQAMTAALDGLGVRWEVVCVDDGSTDRTFERLAALHQADSRFKALGLSRNFGKEAALTAGLDHAAGDVIVPIDFDLQDPPELIGEMLALWREGNDVVYATRRDREGESWFKKRSAAWFYRVIGRMSSVPVPADTGDFRLMDRRVLETLKRMKETHRFMKGLFAWVGYRQVSLPYVRKPRAAGETKWGYWKLWNFAVEGITGFSIAPLQIAAYLGFVVALAAFFYALFIIAEVLLLGVDVPGYASLLVSVLFMGGVQLIGIGVVGEYVGRIYDEVKRRPLYVVDRTLGV